jgi:hypothetical protein
VDESWDSLDRLTTAEAASRLGISEAGVRKRVQREQIAAHERDETGRLWVYLDTSKTAGQQSRDRENRRIIAALTQRIPELPPPAQEEVASEPRGAHESTASEQDRESPARLVEALWLRTHRDLGGGGGSVSNGERDAG